MELSIIIALYNTEKYIKKCIESIYENNNLDTDIFEVIVINDGSQDDSPKIVRELQNNYTNLILLNKENGGQSSARNIGFKRAQGKYIFCLDSDDYVNSFELEKALYFCVEEKLDLLPINLMKYNENQEQLTVNKDNYEVLNEAIDGGEFLTRYVTYGSMCRYIYKKSIIDNNNLYLTEGIYHEDEEFVIKFISYCNLVSYKSHLVYHQIVRSNSTTKNKNIKHRTKLLKDLTIVLVNLNAHRSNFKKDSLEYIGVSKKIEQLLISMFLRMRKDKISKNDKIQIIKQLTSNKLLPIEIEYSNLKFKIFSFFVNVLLSLRLY